MTKTEIANLTMSHLGVTTIFTAVDSETSTEALAFNRVYEQDRDAVLRDFPWAWAKTYASPLLAYGTTVADANADWTYAYRYPADCLFLRRITTSDGRQETDPPPFSIGRDSRFASAIAWSGATAYVYGDLVVTATVVYQCILAHTNHAAPNATYWTVVANSRLIFTDQASAAIEYTGAITDPEEFDVLFTSMLSWKIAASLAPALSRMTDIAVKCLEVYAAERNQAISRSVGEAQHAIATGDASATVREILHMALTRIGVVKTAMGIQSEISFEAIWPRVNFAAERNFVLRDFAWPWAASYSEPLRAYGSIADDEPANTDWLWAYRYPSDCLFVRRIVTAAGRLETTKRQFSIGRDPLFGTAIAWSGATAYVAGDLAVTAGIVYQSILAGTNHAQPNATYWTVVPNARLIFTNEGTDTEGIEIEYTAEITDALEFDPIFKSMLAWKIAGSLAPSLTDKKENVAGRCLQMYAYEKSVAESRALNEGEPQSRLEAEWITGR